MGPQLKLARSPHEMMRIDSISDSDEDIKKSASKNKMHGRSDFHLR